ncbi:MAG: Fic family protein [Oscillospiraceae bacterium]|nr:Fic family protein [Oscillospiraceae bacterium]
MGYSIDPISANCYPDTTVFINKFDIRDEEKLNEVESVLASVRYAEWLNAPKADSFDFEHYKAIHHFLFSDLYDWAGQIRTVNISKKGTNFTPAENIEEQTALIFKRLKNCNYFKGLKHSEFLEEIVDFYCVTNALHPFREGNGRTQRVFLTQLIRNAGHDINFADMDTELLMIATIQSAQGVTDMLRQMFWESIK